MAARLSDARNFRHVDDRLLTAGQPNEEQLADAASQGCKVVINLALHDDPRYSLHDEGGTVRGLGMDYVHIPVQFKAPTLDDFVAFCEAMDANAGEKMLVHCAANYRVTAFIGLYRIVRLGWDPDQAFAPMRSVWQPDDVWTRFIAETLEKSLSRPIPISIRLATVDEIVASGLIAELDADLLLRYPGEPINGVDVNEFRAAGGVFIAAQDGDRFVGCGAFRPHEHDTVEIKRMFVRPTHRGRGLGRAILRRLEDEAHQRGFAFAVLETGNRQPEAITLYDASGYRRIESFGTYVASARSVCFRKALSTNTASTPSSRHSSRAAFTSIDPIPRR